MHRQRHHLDIRAPILVPVPVPLPFGSLLHILIVQFNYLCLDLLQEGVHIYYTPVHQVTFHLADTFFRVIGFRSVKSENCLQYFLRNLTLQSTLPRKKFNSLVHSPGWVHACKVQLVTVGYLTKQNCTSPSEPPRITMAFNLIFVFNVARYCRFMLNMLRPCT